MAAFVGSVSFASSTGFQGQRCGLRNDGQRVHRASVVRMAWGLPKFPNPFEKKDYVDELMDMANNMDRRKVEKAPQAKKQSTSMAKSGGVFMDLMPGDAGYVPPGESRPDERGFNLLKEDILETLPSKVGVGPQSQTFVAPPQVGEPGYKTEKEKEIKIIETTAASEDLLPDYLKPLQDELKRRQGGLQ